MFKENRILLLLKHEADNGFRAKRLAYANPEEEKKGPTESKDKPLTVDEKKEVIADLQKKTVDSAWNEEKTPTENFEELAKKLYPSSKPKQKFAVGILDETFGTGDARTKNFQELSDKGAKFIRIENGVMKFYKSKDFKKENEIPLATADVVIKTPEVKEEKPGEKPDEEKKPDEGGAKAPKEMSPEQKAALELFKKIFPNAKPEQIRVSGTDTVAVGKTATIGDSWPLPTFYRESGKAGFINGRDDFRQGDVATAEILQGFVIEAPNKEGTPAKFVLAKVTAPYIIGGTREFNAWVDLASLRSGRERFRTETAWSKAKETDETLGEKEFDVRYKTELYHGNLNSANGGVIIRNIEAGDKVKTIDGRKTIKVGDEEYVAVFYTKKGATDKGWIKRSALIAPTSAEEKKAPEVAYKEEKDERANAALVAKYYNRETGKIHFDGDKKAESLITISDLFPNAKAGDKIRIKHSAGGKTMDATFDPNKEYTKFISGKAEKRKGTFAYKNGARVEIWDGDIILPAWEEEKKAEGPQDRAFLQKIYLKEGDTYEAVAEKAMKMDAIAKSFEGTRLSAPEQVAAYVKLLKRYQQGNTLFLVVPTPAEAGIPSAAQLAEERYSKRATDYSEKFRKNREGAEKALRGDLDKYMKEKVQLRPSLLEIINDDEAFRRAWNGDINKEMTGLNKLISVLKHPLFAEAGITEGNAREKIRDLIQEYSNKEVDFEDVVNFLGIYRKLDPLGGPDQKASYSDFKKDLEEQTKIMKENEAGFKSFEARKTEGILKQTEIVEAVMEKRKLAQAQGYKDPMALVTPEQQAEFWKAARALADLRTNDPDYDAWDKYRLASAKVGYLNYVLYEGAQLLEAIGQLDVKEFKADTQAMAVESANMPPETKKCVTAMEDVFRDTESNDWQKAHPGARKFSWEDVVAGTEQNKDEVSTFNQYFDPYAPVVRIRSRLNRYSDDKGNLDGVERISETETVNEFNRLMQKALKRLIAWKNNPAAVVEFLNRYGAAVSLPEKTSGESDEAYAARVTPLLTEANEKAFKILKIKSLEDLVHVPNDDMKPYRMVQDRKELIKMGYYFDSRDEEKGVSEGKEGEAQLSMNPMIRKVQEAAIQQGYPKENIKKVESIFLGGIAIKVDTTKPLSQAFGAGLGTGIDLGDGFTLMVGIGVDSSGAGKDGTKPQPVLGVAIRKGWKLGEEKRTEIGVTGGVGFGLTGPSIGGGIDVSWPISDAWDMKAFAGGSVGLLVSTIGGGIGFGKNYEAAQANLEKEIGGFDPKAIDAEKDPEKKYMMIINNPVIGAFYRSAAESFKSDKDRQQVVLDLYEAHRASVSGKAAEQNSAPFISGFGIAAGVVNIAGVGLVPYVGPYLTFTVDKTVYVYRRQSASSKEMDKVSDAEANRLVMEDVQKRYPGGNVVMKETKAGESGDVIVDAKGEIAVRRNKYNVDLSPFKDAPSIDKYNEALKPYDMKLVPDASGLLELQVFGALGNLEIYMDPGMERKGLIMRDGKVFLAPGAKPELFITREEFFTPFPKKGYYQNTVICITDTPKRTRSQIAEEVTQSGSYLYRKAGKQWEIISAPNAGNGNVMDAAAYEKFKANFDTYSEKVEGFDESKWKEYEAKINGLPFVKDPEPDLTPEKRTELKKFSKNFFTRNLAQYRDLTTVKPGDTEEMVNEKRRKLAALIQTEAKKEPSKGGLGAELSDLQMNFVMSELMDVSFSELEKAGDKRARFEANLEWSKKAVLLPFFRKKVDELNKRGIEIKSTPEQLVDLLVKRLLANVKDEDLGKPGQQLGPNWVFSSVAGAVGTGLRGVPGYISQDKYGVLGLHEEDLAKPGLEGDLAKVILELESPLDLNSDKAMMESPLAKKLIAMPGMWFVLGDAKANQAVDGMQKALKGEKVEGNPGYEEFKKILIGIRDTQLRGGNAFIYMAENGNVFEFRLKTTVADAAHARCGNASFGVKEDIQIFARIKRETGMVVAGGKESTASVSPEVAARFISFGLAGVVTIDTRKKEDTPPGTPPGDDTTTVVDEGGGKEGGGSGTGHGSTGGTDGGPVAPPSDGSKPGGDTPPPTF